MTGKQWTNVVDGTERDGQDWVKGKPQPLDAVLFDEGLSYKALADLCPPQAKLSDQTISDIAAGRRRGDDKSRQKILNALNTFENKKQTYTWHDLYYEPPKRGLVHTLRELLPGG